MSATTDATGLTYEPFAEMPEYREVNRLFIDAVSLGGVERVLDLACGTGLLMELILERRADATSPAPRLRHLVGADLSAIALGIARRRLTQPTGPSGAAPRLGFVQCSAGSLPLPGESVDLVLVGNAIQLFPEPAAVLTEARRILRPGGVLAFNTSFHAGTFVPGTERFYIHWVEEAVKLLRRDGARTGSRRARGAAGAGPAERVVPAFSRPWLSPDDYERLLESSGMSVLHRAQHTVALSRAGLEAIGSYAELAGTLLRGYPMPAAAEALRGAVAPALARSGVEAIPRLWLDVIARKA